MCFCYNTIFFYVLEAGNRYLAIKVLIQMFWENNLTVEHASALVTGGKLLVKLIDVLQFSQSS